MPWLGVLLFLNLIAILWVGTVIRRRLDEIDLKLRETHADVELGFSILVMGEEEGSDAS